MPYHNDNKRGNSRHKNVNNGDVSNRGGSQDPVAAIPKRYRKIELKHSNKDDFDYELYNKTKFCGLDANLPNNYCNVMLQVSNNFLFSFYIKISDVRIKFSDAILFGTCSMHGVGSFVFQRILPLLRTIIFIHNAGIFAKNSLPGKNGNSVKRKMLCLVSCHFFPNQNFLGEQFLTRFSYSAGGFCFGFNPKRSKS